MELSVNRGSWSQMKTEAESTALLSEQKYARTEI